MLELTIFDEATKHRVWQIVMKEELEAIERKQTWSPTDLPFEKNLISWRWLNKTKLPNTTMMEQLKDTRPNLWLGGLLKPLALTTHRLLH